MKYKCYECDKKGIYTEVQAQNSFISEDGRVLCSKCSVGVKPCTDRQRFLSEVIADKEKCFYYLQKDELFIKSKILDFKSSDEEFKIYIETGELIILNETEIKKVNRPANIIAKFNWCYNIKNSNKELIGWIGRLEE